MEALLVGEGAGWDKTSWVWHFSGLVFFVFFLFFFRKINDLHWLKKENDNGRPNKNVTNTCPFSGMTKHIFHREKCSHSRAPASCIGAKDGWAANSRTLSCALPWKHLKRVSKAPRGLDSRCEGTYSSQERQKKKVFLQFVCEIVLSYHPKYAWFILTSKGNLYS